MKQLCLVAALLMVVALLPGWAAGQTIIYVNAAAAPGGSGQSWGTAHRDLQSALTQAEGILPGDRNVQVWVAQGVYKPSERLTANDPRSVTFRMLKGVAVYGGFVGTESALTERNPRVHLTTLSGDLAEPPNDGPGFVNRNDNAYSVLSAISGSDATAVIDGFRIRGGENRTTGTFAGGGLYATAAFTLRTCWVFDNQASVGGGLYLTSGAFGSVDACWIFGNEGAGFYNNGANVTISNSAITNNHTVGDGGGFGVAFGSVALVNCTVAYNSAGTSGGACHLNLSDVQFQNSIFFANSAPSGDLFRISATTGTIQTSLLSGNTVRNPNQQPGEANNIGGDPLFVDADGLDNVAGNIDDNFRLRFDSPCVDPVMRTTPLNYADLDGRRRIYDGHADGMLKVDYGAFEYRAPVYSPILYVRASASGSNDGSDWANAFSGTLGLTNALALAAVSPGAYQQVWVGVGTYKPAGPGGSRSASFQLQNNLAIYGGFTGTESSLLQRDITANPTALSGDLNADDLPGNFSVNRTDNSMHVVTALAGLSASAVLDGVLISGGHSTDSDEGGGVRIVSSSPTLARCVFTDNDALAGGGLGCAGTASPLVMDCLFSGNAAGSGGAASCSSSSTPLFLRCQFTDNTGTVRGPGCYVHDGADGYFVQCDFVRNVQTNIGNGELGGAIAAYYSARASAYNCRFLGNKSDLGSAMGAWRSGEIRAYNCVAAGNQSRFGAFGAGSSSPQPSAMTLVNCTVVGNVGLPPNNLGVGAGVWWEGGVGLNTVSMSNCLIWGNGTNLADELAEIWSSSGPPYNLTIRHCTIKGLSGYYGNSGNGNTGTTAADNPLFVRLPAPGVDGIWTTADDDYGDLRLNAGSPAIDAGDLSSLPQDTWDIDGDGNLTEVLPFDLLGFPRFVDDPAAPNTGPGSAPHVDRGAYESQVNCLTCPGPREWRSAIGGLWDFPSNWTPSVPLSTHDTLFNLSATYTVTLPSAQSLSVNSAMFSKGGVSFSLGGSSISLLSISTTSFELGTLANTAAAVSLTGGTINAVDARVGSAVASTGTLNIGAGGLFSTSRSLTVGFQGVGNLNISGGGRVFSRDATVGDQATSRGTVSVTGAGSRWDIPFFLIIDGGEVNVSSGGALTTGFGTYLFNQGRISGDGTINGSVVNFGSIVPGNSPGTLTINGNYEQVGQIVGLGAAAGRIEAQVGGTTPGTYDRVVVNGAATLGGGLYVSLMNDFVPAATDAFPLVSASSGLVKPFDVIFFPALPPPTTGAQKFLRANYSGLRGPGGGLVTVGVADLGINPNFGSAQPTSLTGGPSSAAIGDLNGDGLPDLAIAIPDPNQPATQAGQVVVLFNRGGSGTAWLGFQSGTQQIAVGVDPRAIAIADLDGVNGNDLIVANAGSNTLSILTQTTTPGTFGGQQTQSVGVEPVSVAVGDFDRDDSLDVVVANRGGAADTGSLSLLENISTTPGVVAFVPRLVPLPTQRKPTHVNPFNPDNDKDLDVAVTMTDLTGAIGEFAVVINGLDNNVAPPLLQAQGVTTRVAVGAAPVQSAAARFLPNAPPGTAPIRQDVITVSPATNSVTVLVNNTLDRDTASFAAPVDYVIPSGGASGSAPISVALVDMDDDALKDPDIAVLSRNAAGNNREIKILRNDSTVAQGSNPSQIAFAQVSQGLAAGGMSSPPFTLLVGNVDGDGRPDLVTVNAPGLRGNTSSVQVLRNALPPPSQTLGACCIGASCLLKPLSECVGAGQHFIGLSAVCNLPTDFRTPCCKADMNQSGSVSIDDLFLYLNGWFTGQTPADTDSSGVITIDDLFLFLNAWFLGC